MFSLFDKDQNKFLNKEEFNYGFSRLFSNSFDDNCKFVFDLFDFDSDGKIGKKDIHILLSHIPPVQILDTITEGSTKEGQFSKKGNNS